MKNFLLTTESVTEGHPDKVCDRISDSILDALLAQDPLARCACETVVKNDLVVIVGEITSSASVDYEAVAREAIRDIGYTDTNSVFNAKDARILLDLAQQSPDIALGVDASLETKQGGEEENGAGDQGMMFGYACNETPELMPLGISLAHKLCKGLAEARKNGTLKFLRPDGKAQVTVEYRDGKPVRIDTVVLSTQHSAEISMEELRSSIKEEIIDRLLPQDMVDENTKYYINPTGRFVVGGPEGDSGLTGRKLMVDTYGSAARHGGGCFSGKDPTKVDRSAAYMARYAAKNVVAAGLASRCELQIAYAIGVAQPVSIYVETFGTETIAREKIARAVSEVFDFRPSSIIRTLDLRRPIYSGISSYGQVGRAGLPYENTDRAAALLEAVSKM